MWGGPNVLPYITWFTPLIGVGWSNCVLRQLCPCLLHCPLKWLCQPLCTSLAKNRGTCGSEVCHVCLMLLPTCQKLVCFECARDKKLVKLPSLGCFFVVLICFSERAPPPFQVGLFPPDGYVNYIQRSWRTFHLLSRACRKCNLSGCLSACTLPFLFVAVTDMWKFWILFKWKDPDQQQNTTRIWWWAAERQTLDGCGLQNITTAPVGFWPFAQRLKFSI